MNLTLKQRTIDNSPCDKISYFNKLRRSSVKFKDRYIIAGNKISVVNATYIHVLHNLSSKVVVMNFLPFNLWINSFCGTNTGNKNNLFKVATFDPGNKFSAILTLTALKIEFLKYIKQLSISWASIKCCDLSVLSKQNLNFVSSYAATF